MKVVINREWGGFGLSDKAKGFIKARGLDMEEIDLSEDCNRTNPILIEAVEALGEEANTEYAKLKVVEIPDGTEFYIYDYDGMETIHENHQQWN